MQQSKFVVVEVSTTPSTMTLIQYLITNGFDKFAVVSDLSDHPSLKYKPQTNGSLSRPKASINEIASALSKRSSPTEANGFTHHHSPSPVHLNGNGNKHHTALTRILEDQSRAMQEQKREQDRQQQEIQRIILAQARNGLSNPFVSLESDERNCSPGIDEDVHLFGSSVKTETAVASSNEPLTDSGDSGDLGLGPSDEQVRASMIHLLNPVLGSAFGSSLIEDNGITSGKRKSGDDSTGSKKHRWMTADELEESRFGRSKNYGRVHCKATYKCALCGKPTTLNSTGSRWNLLRHVIMIHSDSKPYQCWDCDFIGIKSNVISHARQSNHRSDDAHDVTTDTMRAEWNAMLHQCFPDYVKAKAKGWQGTTDEDVAPNGETTEIKIEAECLALDD